MTTMTASMITTATTMMTAVVVAPSCGGILVGCMVWEGVGVDAVERKHTSCHFTYSYYHEPQTRVQS